jgi:hypothetical protein
MELPMYGDLGQATVRQQLGLSAAQETRLREISAECQEQMQKCFDERQRLTPEELERKRPQLTHENTPRNAFGQQVEALLSPRQLAALKEIAFRGAAPVVLTTALAGPGRDTIGIKAEQRGPLEQVVQAWQTNNESTKREMAEKSIGVLTASQQRQLRSELDRRAAW